MGKYQVEVCMGTACFVKKSQPLLDQLNDLLKIDMDGLSEDGLFSLKSIRCLGACGIGPVVKINDKIYGKVTLDMIDSIISEYRSKELGDEGK